MIFLLSFYLIYYIYIFIAKIMSKLNYSEIEKKWQKYWKDNGTNKTSDDFENGKKKFYILDMFPYPSGEGLHVGHPKGYIATDVYSRMKKMQGYNVLHPMGWDAFGLPAEQYAIKNKINPNIGTMQNVARYKEQIEMLGINYDWDREINTTDPKYYKWTQWMWKQMYKDGLAHESFEPINWCPSCKTGLANEDLDGNTCERCGTIVEKKPLRQWVIKITDYADRLLNDLDKLNWEPHIKELQRNWIGKSEGAIVKFNIENSNEVIEVFTTRIDTIFSGTFVIVAPEHRVIKQFEGKIQNLDEVYKYLNSVKNKNEIERMDKENKTGVELKGVRVINPATKDILPVWVSDFVLGDYGTGSVFADAHDQRDFDFAKIYNIPLKVSIKPENVSEEDFVEIKNLGKCYEGEGILISSEEFDGMTSKEARPKITEWLKNKDLADFKITFKLKDWVFARQRYWGEPFPIVFDENHKSCAVADKELPVILPNVENYEPTDTGESPLTNIKDWVEVYGYINSKGEFESISGTHPEREIKTINTYKENFETYISETVQEISGEWKEESDFLAEKLKGKRVLEIGSASGREAIYLKNKGVDIIASDIVDSFSKIAEEKGLEFLNID
ncbi:MAG: hypothetical protein RI945_11, partial [Candidatus Parcubacteria bacterium]